MACAFSDAVQHAEDAHTETDTFGLMHSATQRYGFQYFAIIDTRSAFSTRKDASIVTNWSDEMMRAYDNTGIISNNAVYDRFKATSTPFQWQASDHTNGRSIETQQKIMTFCDDFSITNGLCIPVFAEDGTKYRFCYSGKRPPLSPTKISELFLISTTVFQTYRELHEAQQSCFGAVITPRECECLRWTAAGKTSEEIAIILGLSKHTVNHYLAQCMQKLDCVNRTHAVAKAMRKGWLG